MSAALTFGSLGDIIAICQLVNELGQALSDSRGSGREYRDLRQDLDAFVRILMLVCLFPISQSQLFINSIKGSRDMSPAARVVRRAEQPRCHHEGDC